MEHIADVVPMVQILDIPVLLGADQLVEVGRHLDFLIPKKVIEVPKISLDQVPRHRMVDLARPPQMAEQLADDHLLLYAAGLSSRPWTFQFLMIVVAGAVEEAFKVSLKDRVQLRFLEQNSSTFQFLRVVVDGTFEEASKVSRKDRVQQRVVEQIMLTLQFLRVVAGGGRGLLGFRPDPNSAASSSRSYAVDEPCQRVFRTFPQMKKCAGLGPYSGSELGADFNPWTPGGLCRVHGVRLRRV